MFGLGPSEFMVVVVPLILLVFILPYIWLFSLLGILRRFVKAYEERTQVLRENRTDS